VPPIESAHGGAADGAAEHVASALRARSGHVPEPPATANGRNQQQPMDPKLAPSLNPRAAHQNTLVMRSS